MKYIIFVFLLLVAPVCLRAQKPFTEGAVVYKVLLTGPDQKEVPGTYTFTVKGNHVRKELKLSNGYCDVVLFDFAANSIYSLQDANGRKYAIELNMQEWTRKAEKYAGFNIDNEVGNQKNIAGYTVYKGNIKYKNNTGSEIYYCKDWYPGQINTFERFPGAKFIPVSFSYTNESNAVMKFEVERISAGPVENSEFRIPADYKIISNAEYKQLSR
jgi:hypothetical protein